MDNYLKIDFAGSIYITQITMNGLYPLLDDPEFNYQKNEDCVWVNLTQLPAYFESVLVADWSPTACRSFPPPQAVDCENCPIKVKTFESTERMNVIFDSHFRLSLFNTKNPKDHIADVTNFISVKPGSWMMAIENILGSFSIITYKEPVMIKSLSIGPTTPSSYCDVMAFISKALTTDTETSAYSKVRPIGFNKDFKFGLQYTRQPLSAGVFCLLSCVIGLSIDKPNTNSVNLPEKTVPYKPEDKKLQADSDKLYIDQIKAELLKEFQSISKYEIKMSVVAKKLSMDDFSIISCMLCLTQIGPRVLPT